MWVRGLFARRGSRRTRIVGRLWIPSGIGLFPIISFHWVGENFIGSTVLGKDVMGLFTVFIGLLSIWMILFGCLAKGFFNDIFIGIKGYSQDLIWVLMAFHVDSGDG